MKEVTYNSSLLKDSWNSNETVKPNNFNELSGAVKNVIANANDLAHNYLQQGKQYVAGDIVYSKNLNKGCYLLCKQGGTTGDSEPQLINKNVGETVTDGTVVWTVQKVGNAQLNSSNTFTALNTFRANIAVSSGTTAGSGGRIDFGISPAAETVQARISADALGGLFYHASTNQPHVFRVGTSNEVFAIRNDSSKMWLTTNVQPFAIVPYEGVAKWLGNANTATKLETARTINGVEFDGTKNITIEAGGIVDSLLAQNGYVKFANGLILQWGTNAAASSSSGETISYPLAFSSAVYSVAIVPEGGNQASKWGVSSITTSNFKYYRIDGSPTGSRWLAIGK